MQKRCSEDADVAIIIDGVNKPVDCRYLHGNLIFRLEADQKSRLLSSDLHFCKTIVNLWPKHLYETTQYASLKSKY